MGFVFALIFWFVGLVIGSFGFVQLFIIFGFGIPYTKDLERLGILNENNHIIKGYIFSIVLWVFVILITTILIFSFVSQLSFIAYCIGIGLMIIGGFGQCGASENNITDYVNSNKKYMNY